MIKVKTARRSFSVIYIEGRYTASMSTTRAFQPEIINCVLSTRVYRLDSVYERQLTVINPGLAILVRGESLSVTGVFGFTESLLTVNM